MNTKFMMNKLQQRQRRRQRGFSLVELGVVLLVVSILIGGVLKGRELIGLSKLQRLESDLESVQTSAALYRDYYQHLPGDDPSASQRFTSHGAVENGNGNNQIEFSQGSQNGENSLFWQHLRAAGLLKLAANDKQAPSNPFGGEFRLGENVYGLPGVSVVATGLSWQQAFTLDQRQDDSNGGQGRIRIGAGGHVLSAPPSDVNIRVEVAAILLP